MDEFKKSRLRFLRSRVVHETGQSRNWPHDPSEDSVKVVYFTFSIARWRWSDVLHGNSFHCWYAVSNCTAAVSAAP